MPIGIAVGTAIGTAIHESSVFRTANVRHNAHVHQRENLAEQRPGDCQGSGVSKKCASHRPHVHLMPLRMAPRKVCGAKYRARPSQNIPALQIAENCSNMRSKARSVALGS